MRWVVALTAMLAVPALAKSPCKELKPRGKIDPETVSLVSSVARTALTSAGVPLPVGGLPAGATSLFERDAGARDLLLYKICTMKEAGLLSPEKAEELVAAALMGQSASPAGLAAAPPGLSPQQLASRAQIVSAAEAACKIRGPGGKAVCDAHKSMLEQYDAQYAAAATLSADVPPPPVPLSERGMQTRAELEHAIRTTCVMPGPPPACAIFRKYLADFDAAVLQHPEMLRPPEQ